MDLVKEIMESSHIPSGCNSSFITLTSKVSSHMVVNDFRPISLIEIQYKIIAKLLALRLARIVDTVVSVEHTAFIKGRQILNGPLLVNELVDWYKKKKKKMVILKIDFEKAFDSISWDYLDNMLEFVNFLTRWRRWISACLYSARSSLLINGSPTQEFMLHRGMDNLRLSHLFYADDVLFLGDWSQRNVDNLLHFFFMASGLKINFSKSNLYGIEMKSDHSFYMWEINASEDCPWFIGHIFLSMFVMHVGVAKQLESMRSHFFWGCNSHQRKMAWVSWDSVMASYSRGGLHIGSLVSFNLSLLLKWRWRFVHNDNMLWVHVIKHIYGQQGGFESSTSRITGSTRLNLHNRDIDTPDILCPICKLHTEYSTHLFIGCEVANSTWVAIGVWIELVPMGVLSVVGLFSWLDSLNFNSKKKNLIEAVFFTTIWMLWRLRNDMAFGNNKIRKDRIMESSATREYPSPIHTFFLTHTVGGVFLNPEDKALYDEMLRIQGLGSNIQSSVPYTDDEIMAIVHGGKKRGHILGVGRLESQPEYDGGRRSGRCEDDEPRDDEDGGEDGEDEDDS
nr:RNA-directed DNA polymerase, eukaryota, reverse transcriptase zinc-binding domain protein [Tanacetum cinerariifolium]